MEIALAVACFVVSGLAFGWGFLTEVRQQIRIKRGEPVSVVPTLPFAVQAAVFVMFCLCFLPIPWWIAPIGLVIAVIVLGKMILYVAK